MRASVRWLRELSGVDATVDDLVVALNRLGLEVEAVERFGAGLDAGFTVVEVRGRRKHPARDKLTLVEVFDGAAIREVVCGAPNVPDAGGRVILAGLGARLPDGLEIAERDIGGVVSAGMLCSETELGLGEDGAGIVVLGADDPGAPGDPLSAVAPVDDVILEIGVTPNRPDALGHVGLARELAAAHGVDFHLPAPPPAPAVTRVDGAEGTADLAPGAPFRVVLEAPDRCPRYGAALVTGLTVRPSPLATRVLLHRLGVRALDNLVDATNVTLFEWGHPIHGFDLGRLRGGAIHVRLARPGEVLRTLDDVERPLTDDDLLICDAEGPVALAGVMGGADSEMHDGTRDVLIECAWFQPRSVRRTGRRQGLSSEAGFRFERGVDPGAVPRVLASAAARLARAGGGAVAPVALDVVARPPVPARLQLRPARASALLGIPVDAAAAAAALGRIGCRVEAADAEGALPVEAPTWRPDLTREVDLIEEIGRLRGFDAIPAELPSVRPSEDGSPPEVAFTMALRRTATHLGLDEAVNLAFLSSKEQRALGVPDASVVALQNPLSEERSVLRASLLPGLLGNLRRARRHQVPAARLFEIGTVFAPGDGPGALPVERRHAALVLGGPRDAWIGDGPEVDFYDGKGVVQGWVEAVVGAPPAATSAADDPDRPGWVHPRRGARLTAGDVSLGWLGELHPDVCDALDLGGRGVAAELSVEALLAARAARGTPAARPLPRFPAVTRDLALVLDSTHPADDVAVALRDASGGLAEDVRLFDVYTGAHVADGQRSLAFRLVYRDPDATLTDKRVDEVHGRVTRTVTERFGATVR